MANIILFPGGQANDVNRYKWANIPLSLQAHYNYLLNRVLEFDKDIIKPPSVTTGIPNYYNQAYCLTLTECLNASGTSTSTPSLARTIPRTSCTVDADDASRFLVLPGFHYVREFNGSNPIPIPPIDPDPTKQNFLDLKIDISSLTVGSIIWLYYYERMGIFKILGALMDDYNYKGKFPISSKVKNSTFDNLYTFLIENVSLLYRQGLSSNLRDRICAYERVLGVTIDNNMNIDTVKNEGFMKTFNKLIDYMLEFYKAKQLAQAIQNTNGTGVRSSVATQTSIRDTILVMKQHLEAMEYGRNMVNTFIGIATVYITICLVRLIKDEIGIPKQYDSPDEFIPAAYDILVLKRAVTAGTTNRFTIYDNCASYGYRLLTDIELADVGQFRTNAQNSPLDLWLNDVEGTVEGYNNAYKSVEEPAAAMV
jgi:hypothetical protein